MLDTLGVALVSPVENFRAVMASRKEVVLRIVNTFRRTEPRWEPARDATGRKGYVDG